MWSLKEYVAQGVYVNVISSDTDGIYWIAARVEIRKHFGLSQKSADDELAAVTVNA